MTVPLSGPVMVVGHEASRTGSVGQLLSVVAEWRRAGRQVSVVLRRGGPMTSSFEALAPTTLLTPPGLRRLRIPFDRAKRGGIVDSASWLLHNATSRTEPPAALLLNTATHGDLIERLPQVPTVTWVHEQGRFLDQLVRPRALRRLVGPHRQLVAVSHSVRDDVAAMLSLDPATIAVVRPAPAATTSTVSHAAARAALLQELGAPPDALLVGACGALSWEKSPAALIDLAEALVAGAAGRRVYFAWLGDGRDPATRSELSRDAGGRRLDNVTFLGSRSDPTPFFRALDVFVVVSATDAFPIAALEAARESVPVVCLSETGGIKEFVGDDAGVVVPGRDPLRMVDVLRRLAGDEAMRRRLGSVAAERIRQDYDAASVADQLWLALQAAAQTGRR
jgi:glycosyltransferase involved in cell wall biosynthesis